VTGFRRVEHIMGTAIGLHIADPLPQPTLERLAADVFGWFREVDGRFSTYLANSEVNRLDRGDVSLEECSPDLRTVLDECGALWRATDGYFDVYATGRLDPSGYVKGWSVQVASDRLLAAGAVNHWVNAGGDVRVRGHEMLVAVSGLPGGTAVIRSFVTNDELTEGVGRAWLLLGILGIGLLFVSVLVAIQLALTLTAPLFRVAATAHRLASGDLGVRAMPGGRPEVHQVGTGLNLLAARIGCSPANGRPWRTCHTGCAPR
jgi:hypothetical protein